MAAVLTATALISVSRADDISPSDNLEAVTVFGSRTKDRSVFDSAVPIDVFSSADVKRALVSGELGQALQDLSPSINMPRASSSGTSDSVRTIQLRGLAPDQVLVLVNGKRRHTNAVMDIEGLFPGTVAVDLNAIPEEAIDHIEILRDGAGAMYGSDAIAGVVNIVLKSGTAGGEVDALAGANHTYFAPTGETITDGRSKTVSFDYGVPLGQAGSIHFGADYRDTGATNRAGPTSSSASYNSTPADLALNDKVVFASGDPTTTNKSLFYNASWPGGDGYELYSFGTYNYRDTWGDAFFRYPGDPTNVPSVYPAGYRPVSTGVSQDASVVIGTKLHRVGWTFDVSAREGYNTFAYGLENSLNASLGPQSPTSFHVADFTYEERALNLDVSRQLPLAGLDSPLDVALGAEYLHESYHTSPGDPASYEAGPYTYDAAYGEAIPPGSQGDNGLSPQDAVHLRRHVASAYVDLDQDVTSRLLLGLAGRYSNYSDYGSSTTGKFSARYKLTDDWLCGLPRRSASGRPRSRKRGFESRRSTSMRAALRCKIPHSSPRPIRSPRPMAVCRSDPKPHGTIRRALLGELPPTPRSLWMPTRFGSTTASRPPARYRSTIQPIRPSPPSRFLPTASTRRRVVSISWRIMCSRWSAAISKCPQPSTATTCIKTPCAMRSRTRAP